MRRSAAGANLKREIAPERTGSNGADQNTPTVRRAGRTSTLEPAGGDRCYGSHVTRAPASSKSGRDGYWLRAFKRSIRLPLYPLLLAAYPVLHLYSENLDEGVGLSEVVPALALTLAGTAIVYMMLWAAWRSTARAAVVTCAVIVPFLLYGSTVDAVQSLWPGSPIVRSLLVALLAWVAIVLLTTAVAARVGRRLPQFTEPLNLVALVLLALVTIPIVRFAFWPVDAAMGAQEPRSTATSGQQVSSGRDIYHFVFDRYGSESSLSRLRHRQLGLHRMAGRARLPSRGRCSRQLLANPSLAQLDVQDVAS